MPSPESLSLFMFQKPKTAKRLYFDVIPRAVDEYLQFLAAYPAPGRPRQQLDNPVWHIHAGAPPAAEMPVTFGLLLNLVVGLERARQGCAVGLHPPPCAGATPENDPMLDQLAGYAIRYYEDFVKPKKTFRPPDEVESSRTRRPVDAALG